LNKIFGDINDIEGDLREVCTRTFNLRHHRRIPEERDQTPSNSKRHEKADSQETGLGKKAADDLFLVLNRT
jgi:hypothetical protein